MSEREPPPDEQPEGQILGSIPSGPADSHLKVRKRLPDPLPEPRPQLPRGAWLRLVISGGLVFRSSELVVFNDGRITYKQSASAVAGQTLLVRQLTDAQVGVLRSTIAAINFAELGKQQPGRLGADRLVYEITLRAGRKLYAVEALQGAIPELLVALIRQLGELVRVAAEETEV